MGLWASLVVASAVIVLGAVAGALLPLYVRQRRLHVTLLAFAAGVMFGAAFFLMLPEAHEAGGYPAFAVAPLGFLLLFVLERYVLVHACEEPSDCHEHGRGYAMTAFAGLAVHSLFDGVALASSAQQGLWVTAAIAITAHKIPSSLALSAWLREEGRSRGGALGYALLYGLMVPAGAGVYLAIGGAVRLEALTAYALAFSAGTFLYIAVSDLLPHINRHGKGDRMIHIVGMVLGLSSMFLLASLGGHAH